MYVYAVVEEEQNVKFVKDIMCVCFYIWIQGRLFLLNEYQKKKYEISNYFFILWCNRKSQIGIHCYHIASHC